MNDLATVNPLRQRNFPADNVDMMRRIVPAVCTMLALHSTLGNIDHTAARRSQATSPLAMYALGSGVKRTIMKTSFLPLVLMSKLLNLPSLSITETRNKFYIFRLLSNNIRETDPALYESSRPPSTGMRACTYACVCTRTSLLFELHAVSLLARHITHTPGLRIHSSWPHPSPFSSLLPGVCVCAVCALRDVGVWGPAFKMSALSHVAMRTLT